MAWHMTQWRKANGRSAKYGMTKQDGCSKQYTILLYSKEALKQPRIVSNFFILHPAPNSEVY